MTIFLDHASTTPLDPEVAAAMIAVLQGPLGIGNAASTTHAFGREAAASIESARSALAQLIGAAATDIIFTSGATEADNLAIVGLARGRAAFGKHLVTAKTEHKAVLDPCKQLQKFGWQISWLEPQRDGRIAVETVAAALRPDTQLVSIMHANNETGVVQEIAAIAALCRSRGVFLHCDAAQSAGRLAIDVESLGIDLLSISAHKLYGPKGIGALWVAPHARPWLEPLMWGGGHERGLRPGTAATHQIVGFGRAAEILQSRRAADTIELERLAQRFRGQLSDLEGLTWNDHPEHRLPGLLSLSIAGVEGESLLAALPELAVSSGAACDSANGEPSYVLQAQGVSPELAQSTLRIAFGRFNSAADADTAAAAVRRAVLQLRGRDAPGAPAGSGWHAGVAGSIREGARIRCYLRLDQAACIEALEFRALTCPQVARVLEWLQEDCLGRPATAPIASGPRDWAKRFALPVEKLGRLLKVEDALRAAASAALK